MIGSTILHYEVLQKLGEGGMGIVYKARDTRLERFIALKVLPAEKGADSEQRRRFIREAKSASALNHANIVTIHDIDTADNFYFIAMEYIDGHSLDRAIPRKGMRIPDVFSGMACRLLMRLPARTGLGFCIATSSPVM